MIEKEGDLFQLAQDHVLVITTNGTRKKNGDAVMGRGCALEAKQRWPFLPAYLGEHLRRNGNVVGYFSMMDDEGTILLQEVVTFPVKHNWHEEADMGLIKQSAKRLVEGANFMNWKEVYLPRPGCGNGKLNWADVKEVLSPILDDRFIVVTFPTK